MWGSMYVGVWLHVGDNVCVDMWSSAITHRCTMTTTLIHATTCVHHVATTYRCTTQMHHMTTTQIHHPIRPTTNTCIPVFNHADATVSRKQACIERFMIVPQATHNTKSSHHNTPWWCICAAVMSIAGGGTGMACEMVHLCVCFATGVLPYTSVLPHTHMFDQINRHNNDRPTLRCGLHCDRHCTRMPAVAPVGKIRNNKGWFLSQRSPYHRACVLL